MKKGFVFSLIGFISFVLIFLLLKFMIFEPVESFFILVLFIPTIFSLLGLIFNVISLIKKEEKGLSIIGIVISVITIIASLYFFSLLIAILYYL